REHGVAPGGRRAPTIEPQRPKLREPRDRVALTLERTPGFGRPSRDHDAELGLRAHAILRADIADRGDGVLDDREPGFGLGVEQGVLGLGPRRHREQLALFTPWKLLPQL